MSQQNANYKVSAIVPMYNTERYIQGCVDSLLHQTLPEVEVILVDDGSSDGSLRVCRELYGNNDRVQILAQPRNMGPGAARNAGMQAAGGEYIAFVDSDDALMLHAFDELYRLAAETGADVVHTSGLHFALVPGDPPDLLTVDPKDLLFIPNDALGYRATEVSVLSDDLTDRYEKWRKHAYHWTLGTKLLRRQFLLDHDLRFGDMHLSEDMTFSFGCLFHAKTYVRVPGSYYLYRISNTSVSRRKYTPSFLMTALESLLGACAKVREMMKEMPFFAEHPDARNGAIDYFIEILQKEFIIPIFQELGPEALLAEGSLARFFRERFGDRADYTLHMFFELMKTYPPLRSSTSMLNLEFLSEKREAIEQRIRNGEL